MPQKICIALIIGCSFIFTGCASIVGKSHYPVSFNTEPSGASVQVTDENGVQVFNGTTPATTVLKSGEAYFDRKSYTAKFSKAGYDSQISQINSSISGWYIGGNILFGGLVGWLIVDPITGAMYEIDNTNIYASLPHTNQNFVQQSSSPQNTSPVVVAEQSVAAEPGDALTERFKSLKKLLDDGVIDRAEYDKKKKELLQKL
jgi:hypothetical protein